MENLIRPSLFLPPSFVSWSLQIRIDRHEIVRTQVDTTTVQHDNIHSFFQPLRKLIIRRFRHWHVGINKLNINSIDLTRTRVTNSFEKEKTVCVMCTYNIYVHICKKRLSHCNLYRNYGPENGLRITRQTKTQCVFFMLIARTLKKINNFPSTHKPKRS